MKRRDFFQVFASLMAMALGVIEGGCGQNTIPKDNATPTPDGKVTTPATRSVEKGSVWLIQKSAEASDQYLRTWSAFAFFHVGKKALATEEWKKAWEYRKSSDNERATLGFLYMLAGLIQFQNVPIELTAEYLNAQNTDGNYIVDDHLKMIIEQQTPQLLQTIQKNGLSDVQNGPRNTSVELMITLFALVFARQQLSVQDIQNAQQWAISIVREEKAKMLLEYACLSGILSFGNGKTQYAKDIATLIEYLERIQREDGSWVEQSTGDTSISAQLLATSAAMIGLSLSTRS